MTDVLSCTNKTNQISQNDANESYVKYVLIRNPVSFLVK